MPKLAIYVPKSEMKLIEKWRKRLNFSQVFMRALQAEIQTQQLAKKKKDKVLTEGEVTDVQAAAEYYGRQLDDADESMDQLGHRIGRQQVLQCRLEVKDIQALVKISAQSERDRQDIRLIKRCLEATEAIEHPALRSTRRDSGQRDLFISGYLDGVNQAWNSVLAAMDR